MAAAHGETPNSPSGEEFSYVWGTHQRPPNPIPISTLTPRRTLKRVLADHTFIDYGDLQNYWERHKKGLDHYGYEGVKLLQEARVNKKRINPSLQADLLVRYIMERARQDGHNPIAYISSNYHMDHMTWQLAEAGYTEGSERLLAWQELLRLEQERVQRENEPKSEKTALPARRSRRSIAAGSSSPEAPVPLAAAPSSFL